MPDITLFPAELWREITTLACTDGGPTGRSLALTCRYLNAQTSSWRFHSLAFHSLVHLESFLAVNAWIGAGSRTTSTQSESGPPEVCQPQVQHLWLSFLEESIPGWSSPNPQYDGGAPLCLLDNDASQGNLEDTKMHWDVRFITATQALFRAVSPTLRTLVLAQSFTNPLPPFAMSFPLLKEVTFLGGPTALFANWDKLLYRFDDNLRTAFAGFRAQIPPPHVPALRRVHLCTLRSTDGAAHAAILSDPLLTSAPITHLRLSFLEDSAPVDEESLVPDALARALGVPPPPPYRSVVATPGYFSKTLPRDAPLAHLHHLVLHATQELTGWCGFQDEADSWDVELEQLERVLRSIAGVRRLRQVLVDRPWRSNFRWKERLWKDWVNRMEGGRGCWILSEEDEAMLEGPRDPKDEELKNHMFD